MTVALSTCAYAACRGRARGIVDGHAYCARHMHLAREESAAPTGADRAEASVPTALALVKAVHLGHGRRVEQMLDAADLSALCVVLAAMLPADADRSLLAWTTGRHLTTVPRAPRVAPCGTRSGRQRHQRDGETPCEACDEAERTYQRERHQERRAAERSAQRQQVAS